MTWPLRATLTLHAVQAAAQPVLIGGYLDGAYDLVGVHGLGGSLMTLTLMAAGGAAILYWFGRGRGWVVPALVALWFAEGLQIAMGYGRVLAVHVPLGVAVVAASVALGAWSWTPNARRGRSGRWR